MGFLPVRGGAGAADIVGRVARETLQYEGEHVCGKYHPKLKSEASHAGLKSVISSSMSPMTSFPLLGYLAGFSSETMDGMRWFHHKNDVRVFVLPFQWSPYPFDGYKAALKEIKKGSESGKPLPKVKISISDACFSVAHTMADFFNRIGRSLPIIVKKRGGQIRRNRWAERMQMTGEVECKRVVKPISISQQYGCFRGNLFRWFSSLES
jgi:hypothetical protein